MGSTGGKSGLRGMMHAKRASHLHDHYEQPHTLFPLISKVQGPDAPLAARTDAHAKGRP